MNARHIITPPQKWCMNKIRNLSSSSATGWVHRLDIMCHEKTLKVLVKHGYLETIDELFYKIKKEMP